MKQIQLIAVLATTPFLWSTGARAQQTPTTTAPPASAAAAPVVAAPVVAPALPTQDPKVATALIDRAITALGGADKLNKATVLNWKSKTTITFGDNPNDMAAETTMQGLDHSRQTFTGSFNGNATTGGMLLNGDAGVMDFGGNPQDLDKDGVARQKRAAYLQEIPITMVALKSKDFKIESVADDTVGGKPVAGIKVTAPDSRDFNLYFDKDTGLPVKLVAKVSGFDGQDAVQETTYSDYKPMAGIVKATHIETKRDGRTFLTEQVTDFQILDKVDPKTFATI
jgi:hypothetical protein